MPRLGSSCESGLQSLSARLVGLRLEGLWATSGSWIGAGNKSGEQCKREGPGVWTATGSPGGTALGWGSQNAVWRKLSCFHVTGGAAAIEPEGGVNRR